MTYSDEDDAPPLTDKLDELIALSNFVLEVRSITDAATKLRKIVAETAAAQRKLAGLTKQSAGILDEARTEAARIISAAEEEVREQRNDHEHRDQQLVHFKRLLARLEGTPALRQAREALAVEDDVSGRAVSFAQFETMDPAYAQADSSGNIAVPMSKGMTRTFANKPGREANP